MNKIKLLLLALTVAVALSGCGGSEENNSSSDSSLSSDIEEPIIDSSVESDVDMSMDSSANSQYHQRVTFEVENFGNFVVETYPEYAPDTVNHFLNMVKSGYYNGFAVSEINPGDMILTSESPVELGLSSDLSDPGSVYGEFSENGRSNGLNLERYSLVLNHIPTENDSARAQFMILLSDGDKYEGKYAGFAKVVEGFEIIDRISGSACDKNGAPNSPIVMKNVYINE